MANLSNINNYFVINTSGLVAVGDASSSVLPSLTVPFTVFKSGADSILSIQSGGGNGRPYYLRSNTNGNFAIYDDTACLERLIIASGGDVTISKNLTVTGNTVTLDSSASAGFIVDRANDTSGATYEYKTNGSLKWYTGLRGVSTEDFYLFNNAQGSTTLLISSSNNNAAFGGQVHIDSKPNSGLAYNVLIDVGSNGDGTIGYQTIDQLAANLAISSSSNWLKSSNDIYNTNSGNVGIGETSPQRPLHINGTEGVARFTSTASGNDGFEVGIGTVTDAGTDTLSRQSVISSSNSDALVNFGAGSKTVFCTLPAKKTISPVMDATTFVVTHNSTLSEDQTLDSGVLAGPVTITGTQTITGTLVIL